nr:ABC transporter substrate-binding protein [Desulfobacterales bacterium]
MQEPRYQKVPEIQQSAITAFLTRLFLLLILILSYVRAFAGEKVVVVQSIRVKPYEEAFQGFETSCHNEIIRLIMSELKGEDVEEKIRALSPALVVAIGRDALLKVTKIKDVPILYCLVLHPPSLLSGKENIAGVSMSILPERQLITFKEALPKLETVGLLYDPKRTGYFVKKARDAARKVDIQLIAEEVYTPRDVPSLIKGMKGRIDAFWMLPDITVATPQTVEFLLLFSLETSIPILTFSKKYVELGALMSIGIDAFDVGVQAGELAERLLSGTGVLNFQEVEARKAVITLNPKVAKKLGIRLGKKIIQKAVILNP